MATASSSRAADEGDESDCPPLAIGQFPIGSLVGLVEEDGPGASSDTGFWAVLQDGKVVTFDGTVEPDVLAADFSNAGFGIEIGQGTDTGDQIGLKRVDGEDWFFLEREVALPDGGTYDVVVADASDFSLWSFVKRSFPATLPITSRRSSWPMRLTSCEARWLVCWPSWMLQLPIPTRSTWRR